MGKNKSSPKSPQKPQKRNADTQKDEKSSNTKMKNTKPSSTNKGDNSSNSLDKGKKSDIYETNTGVSSLWIFLGLSITVAMAAIIYTNEDVQMYFVKLTPLGANPLKTIIANENTVPAKDTIQTSQENVKVNKNVKDENVKTHENSNNVKVDKNVKQKHDTKSEKHDKNTINSVEETVRIEDINIEESLKDILQSDIENDNKDTKGKKKRGPSREDYPKSTITNKADFKVRKKLDAADSLFKEGNLQKAAEKFDEILKEHPKSPRALWGKGLVLDSMAEKQRSNSLLEEACGILDTALRLDSTPPDLVKEVGLKLADRLGFRGWFSKAGDTWQFLAEKFPDEPEFLNKQGVANLMMGKNEKARLVFRKVLSRHPDNGFAMVHLGFILKNTDLNYKEAIPMLQRGIDTGEPGVHDARFYTHLGDAYHRMNQTEKAKEIYRKGHEMGLFLSEYQRSSYNAETPLTGRPWWTVKQTTYEQHLRTMEKNWKIIRDEGLAQLNKKSGAFEAENENLSETGDWKQFTLYQRGRKNQEQCKKVPNTCALIDQFPAARDCTRGQIKFSVMHPGVHVWPHTGPTNCRIRAHLGLVVPEGPKIRVAEEVKIWKEGQFIIFDDSFEHEVWHNGTELRLVLIIDFWHPEIPEWERRSLSPI